MGPRSGESEEQYLLRREQENEKRRLRYRTDPEYRARSIFHAQKQNKRPEKRDRDYNKRRAKYATDPAYAEKHRRESRERNAKRRELPPEHAGLCECCGIGNVKLVQDRRHDNNVVRGWICGRCNLNVAGLDLKFTDPERYAKLVVWSERFAPNEPVVSPNPRKRVLKK